MTAKIFWKYFIISMEAIQAMKYMAKHELPIFKNSCIL